MARQERQESASGHYHVMLRGINREFIFEQEADKEHFMQFLTEQRAAGAFSLFAWCVMGNHAHSLLRATKDNLSRSMKVIGVKYAGYYNKTRSRSGSVFGERFRSEAVEDDAYLLGALRYIHLNPVKAKLVADESAYFWSSYREFFATPRFIDEGERATVLELCGGNGERFAAFHRQDDSDKYLETQEDREKQQEAKIYEAIEIFCRRRGVIAVADLKRHPALFTEICKELVLDVRLSLREAAKYLETSHQKVHAALQD